MQDSISLSRNDTSSEHLLANSSQGLKSLDGLRINTDFKSFDYLHPGCLKQEILDMLEESTNAVVEEEKVE